MRTSVTGDNEDSYSSDWSSTDVSVNEDQDDAGEQEREMAQWEIAHAAEGEVKIKGGVYPHTET